MTSRRRWLILAVLATVVACGARSGLDVPVREVAAARDGGVDANDATMPPDVISPPPGLDCAEAGITYIFAIGFDANDDAFLYSFYPTTAEFTQVGSLSCPVAPGDTPFSMAVDHSGTAYVVYATGRLFKVSTRTADCQPTSFVVGQGGFDSQFGMGFVAGGFDGGGGETLYIAGTPGGQGSASVLGTIDVNTFKLTSLGPIGEAPGGMPVTMPELTGTGGGRLYGFFAQDSMLPPSFIVGIDPKTLNVISTVDLPDVVEETAWAFGFWGGDFYAFTDPDGTTSVVTRYRPSDGSITQVATAPFGIEIVGAGVSTCAPQ